MSGMNCMTIVKCHEYITFTVKQFVLRSFKLEGRIYLFIYFLVRMIETPKQVAQRCCRWLITGSIQGQVGQPLSNLIWCPCSEQRGYGVEPDDF